MRGTTLLIACETLEDEVRLALERTSAKLEVTWVESGLHNVPRRLHSELQRLLESETEGVQRVLLAFGNCGNAVQQLRTGDFSLTMPRVDDCISLLLGSDARREQISQRHRAIYLTLGWMRGKQNLDAEYRNLVDRYGPETAADVIEMTYGNYRTLGLLDTGAFDVDELAGESAEIASLLGLEQLVLPAGISYLEQLMTGPWPTDRFITVPPHAELQPTEFFGNRE